MLSFTLFGYSSIAYSVESFSATGHMAEHTVAGKAVVSGRTQWTRPPQYLKLAFVVPPPGKLASVCLQNNISSFLIFSEVYVLCLVFLRRDNAHL